MGDDIGRSSGSAFPDLGDGADAVLVLEVDDADALGGPAEGPPRVDTILIDAEDLQNVKWIRIRKD